MGGRSGLGEFEQLVLLVVLRLGDEAFAPDIAAALEREVDRGVTRGALYSTLNRLESKGLLAWAPDPPHRERAGHLRRRFEITHEGLQALRARRSALLTLWDGIEHVIDGDGG